jgi:hypothetical protein
MIMTVASALATQSDRHAEVRTLAAREENQLQITLELRAHKQYMHCICAIKACSFSSCQVVNRRDTASKSLWLVGWNI